MKKEEILSGCIEEVRSGKSTVEECLARYPELRDELSPLLQIAAKLNAGEAVPTAEFKLRAKRYLFEKMAETAPEVSRRFRFWPKTILARAIASTLAGLIVIGAAGSSVVYASQSSLPGDMLYAVKTGTENVQLALTVDPVAKANLHLEFAQRRVDEVAKQVKLSRNVEAGSLTSITDQYNDAIDNLSNSGNTQAVNGVLTRMSAVSLKQQLELEQSLAAAPQPDQPALQQTLDNARRGNTIAQVAYDNTDFLKSRPSVSDTELDKGQFHIDGTVVSIQGNIWDIGGTIVRNVHYSGKKPAAGSVVKIQGMVKGGNVYVSNIDVNMSTAPRDTPQVQTTVEGPYNGVDTNGTSNVGGLPVQIASDSESAQLKPGDKVQLQSDNKNDHGKLKVTGRQNRENSADIGTVISGKLAAVDLDGQTVTVIMAGNRVTVNVSAANINDKDLNDGIGGSIRLTGVYKQDNVLYARYVSIN